MRLYGVLLKQSEHLMQCKKTFAAALEDSTMSAHVLWANRQNGLFAAAAVFRNDPSREKSGSETPAGISEPQILQQFALLMHKQHPQTAYRKYAVLIDTISENCDKIIFL